MGLNAGSNTPAEAAVVEIVKLEVAADFIQRLKTSGHEERQAILARSFGSLSREAADAMVEAIETGCERIDERGW